MADTFQGQTGQVPEISQESQQGGIIQPADRNASPVIVPAAIKKTDS